MASDKMIKTCRTMLIIPLPRDQSKAELITQAVINAAWTDFDPDGEAQPEINKDYLIICEYEDSVVRMKTARFDDEGWWRGNGVGLVKHITHYADPNDLLYVHQTKDLK